MNQFLSFVKKEFRHIFRDKLTLIFLFVFPTLLVILFGFAISVDIRDAKIAILDNSHDEASTGITTRLASSGYFQIISRLNTNSELQEVFSNGKVKMAIVFPPRFAETLNRGELTQIQLIADASDLNTASTLTAYAVSIINDYQIEINSPTCITPIFETTTKILYNPELRSVFMFLPGVMSLVLLIVSALMSAVSLTREKEMGTMDVLTVSPLRPYIIICGKILPYLLLSLFNVCLIIALSMFLFRMPINGSYFLLFLVCFLFILSVLSLGILVASVAQNQLVALIVCLVGLMLPTLLLSGAIFPLENIPLALQYLANVFPAKWFTICLRGVMIKGNGLIDIWMPLSVLTTMTLLFCSISIKKLSR